MATRRAVSLVLWSLLGVDHQAVEHAPASCCLDLGAQLVELAGLDEVGDVVVGVEAAARRRPGGSGCGRTPAGAPGLPRCERSGWASRRPWGSRSGAGRERRTRSVPSCRAGQRRRRRAAALDSPRDRIAAATAALPLARLLGHAADAVAAVRAGRSLNDALARCPPTARPGTQALAFHALRWLGAAEVVRAPARAEDAAAGRSTRCCSSRWRCSGRRASRRTPSTRWSTRRSPRRAGARRAAPASSTRCCAASCASARRSSPRRSADPLARFNHPAWWLERLRARLARALAGDRSPPTTAHPPMTLRVNARRASAAGLCRPARARTGSRRASPRGRAASSLARADAGDAAARLRRRRGLGAGRRRPARRAAAARPEPLRARRARARRLRRARRQDRAPARARRPRLLALDRDAGAAGARRRDARAARPARARRRAADAAAPAAWWDGRPFDAILLDAPCSASGIVRRHPDVRWLRRAERHRRARARRRRGCSTRCGRCSRRAAGCSTAPARCSRPRARRRSTLFCNGRASRPGRRARLRPGSCCRCPTMTTRRRRPACPPRRTAFSSP